MIHTKDIQEVFDISNAAERCSSVLNEVQPKLREILDKFKEKYGAEVPELHHYQIHTYESTLKTTMYDARNPEVAKKKVNIGKRAFIELMEAFNHDITVCHLLLEFNGLEKLIYITVETSFYPLLRGVRDKSFEPVIASLDENIEITVYDQMRKINIEKCIEEITEYAKKKRQPWFSFGLSIPLEGDIEEEYIVDKMWFVWNRLTNIREFLVHDAKVQSKAVHIIDLFKQQEGKSTLDIYNRTYEVVYHSPEKQRPNMYRQRFSLSENGQLVTKGQLQYLSYVSEKAPYEVISVMINSAIPIFTSLRALIKSGKYRWEIAKSYALHNANNQELLEKAMKVLSKHNFEINNNKYFLGNYDNDLQSFEEPIELIKERLVKAALIFLDVSGNLELPKAKVEQLFPPVSEQELGADSTEELDAELTSNFDLEVIMENINASKFTFSQNIIRDFHLNLTALEDKHFVILNGISGTGKTQLCRLYANAVYGLDYESDNPYLRVIPVRPDWMDSTALFGYYSSFEKRFLITEFLEMVLQALREREKPHFIVLDEMNLARVEYYLSDYLSAVESKKTIRLHSQDNIMDIPKEIEIPPNLYVIGTINVMKLHTVFLIKCLTGPLS